MKTTRILTLLIALMGMSFLAEARTANNMMAAAMTRDAAVTDVFQPRLPPPPPRPRFGRLRAPRLAPPPRRRVVITRTYRRPVYRHRRVYRRHYYRRRY
ncbi:hypothetical protein GCM10027037_14510 [Mucilaginibacter koreensis]